MHENSNNNLSGFAEIAFDMEMFLVKSKVANIKLDDALLQIRRWQSDIQKLTQPESEIKHL